MAEETSADTKSTPRRRGRKPGTTAGTRAATTRRKRAGGAELVDNLNLMVSELIKENRKLRRQLDKLSSKGTATASGTIEKGLRSIQRRVQRAMGTGTTTRRRRTTTSATATRRRTTSTRPRTTTRRRRASSSEGSSS